MSLALLNCNRLWLPGGSEHTAFHGLTGLLQTWNVDLLCVQETRAPAGAILPVDQPYAYDGLQGLTGCEAGFLVNSTSSSWPVSMRNVLSRFRWRCLSPVPRCSSTVLVCSFYAPHVGRPIATHMECWNALRVSIQKVLHLYPRCHLLLAGDSNLYMGEVMGSARERSGESQLRDPIRGLRVDFQLLIANPVGVPTYRSGSSIDLVIASRSLSIRNIVVHHGASCACPQGFCFPVLGSDHRLITFQIAIVPATAGEPVPSWPVVRDWQPFVRELRPRLLHWTQTIMRIRKKCPSPSVADRRAVLDVLYGDFVSMLWQSVPTRAQSHQGAVLNRTGGMMTAMTPW